MVVAWLLDLKESNLLLDAKFVQLCSDVWNTRINFCVPINTTELDNDNFRLKNIGDNIVRRKIDQQIVSIPTEIDEVLPCKLRVQNADLIYEQPLMDWIEKHRVKGSWIQNEMLSELKV